MSGRSARANLTRLRRHLTITLSLVSVVGIIGLAVVTTIVDRDLREERFRTRLQGHAFRTAALVFFDAEGEWDVGGIEDDAVMEWTDGVLVVDGVTGVPILTTARFSDVDELLVAVLRDGAENGTIGTVTVDGRERLVAGAPFFGDPGPVVDGRSGVAGAVLVTAAPPVNDRRLLQLVWAATALLGFFSAAAAWTIAGRIVRPMADRLDREEAFLATAAHELRSPLTRFQAVAESALSSARRLEPSEARSRLDGELRRLMQINRETTDTVEDLLYLGRLEAGIAATDHERIRLDEILARFETRVPELAVITPGPVEVVGDERLLRHALANLIGNARRHGRLADRELLIEAELHLDDRNVVMRIADNGPGLGPLPERLFERHTSSGVSSGLGLWIVRRIITDHGGTVTADDHDGGAIFTVRLPRSIHQLGRTDEQIGPDAPVGPYSA